MSFPLARIDFTTHPLGRRSTRSTCGPTRPFSSNAPAALTCPRGENPPGPGRSDCTDTWMFVVCTFALLSAMTVPRIDPPLLVATDTPARSSLPTVIGIDATSGVAFPAARPVDREHVVTRNDVENRERAIREDARRDCPFCRPPSSPNPADVRFRIACEGAPFESTTVPDTRTARTGCRTKLMPDCSVPSVTGMRCASAMLPVPGK